MGREFLRPHFSSHRPIMINSFFDMKPIWMLLSLVFGVLFFFLGSAMDSTMIEGFGAIVLVPGLIGLMEKLWPEVGLTVM